MPHSRAGKHFSPGIVQTNVYRATDVGSGGAQFPRMSSYLPDAGALLTASS